MRPRRCDGQRGRQGVGDGLSHDPAQRDGAPLVPVLQHREGQPFVVDHRLAASRESSTSPHHPTLPPAAVREPLERGQLGAARPAVTTPEVDDVGRAESAASTYRPPSKHGTAIAGSGLPSTAAPATGPQTGPEARCVRSVPRRRCRHPGRRQCRRTRRATPRRAAGEARLMAPGPARPAPRPAAPSTAPTAVSDRWGLFRTTGSHAQRARAARRFAGVTDPTPVEDHAVRTAWSSRGARSGRATANSIFTWSVSWSSATAGSGG